MNAENVLCAFLRTQPAGDPTTQLLPPEAESQFRFESNSNNSHLLSINVHQMTSPPTNAGDAQRHPICTAPVQRPALMNPLLNQLSPPPLEPIPDAANQLPEKLHVNTRDNRAHVDGTEQLSQTHLDTAAHLVSYNPENKHYMRQLATSGRYDAAPVVYQPFALGVRPPNLTQTHEAIDHSNLADLSRAPAPRQKTQEEMPQVPDEEQSTSGAILAHFDPNREATMRAFAVLSQPQYDQRYCERHSALQVPLGGGIVPQSSSLAQLPQNSIDVIQLIAKTLYCRPAAAAQPRPPQPAHPVFNRFRGQLLGPDLMRAQVSTVRNPLVASLPCPPPYPQPCQYPLRFPFPFGPPEQPVNGSQPRPSISFASGIEGPTRLSGKWMFGGRQTTPPPQLQWRRAATPTSAAAAAGASRGPVPLRPPEKSALCHPFVMWRSPSNFQRLNLCSNTNDPNTYNKWPLNLNFDSSPNNCFLTSSATPSAPSPAFDVEQRAAPQEQRTRNRSIFDRARETSEAFPFTALTAERIFHPSPLRQPAALFRQYFSGSATESHSRDGISPGTPSFSIDSSVALVDSNHVEERGLQRTKRKYRKHVSSATHASANAVENSVLAGVEIHSLPLLHSSSAGDSVPHFGTGSGPPAPRKRIKRKKENAGSLIASAGRVAAAGAFALHSSNERTAVLNTAASNTEMPSFSVAAAPFQSPHLLEPPQLATTAQSEGAATDVGVGRRDGQRTHSKGIIGLL